MSVGVYATVHVCLTSASGPLAPQERRVAYVALEEPVQVRTFDAYAAEAHPFAKPDVGTFHDVLTLTSRGDVDGRSLASSSLVRAMKKELGLRVTCRASHH